MLELKIAAMSCNHCVRTITETVQALDPQATVEADLPTHTVRVNTTQPRAGVLAALAEAGYPAG